MEKSNLITINETMHLYGKTFHLQYQDVDTFDELPYKKCRQVYGICFSADSRTKDKIVLGRGKSGRWNLIGGTIETGESIAEALEREIQEESNTHLIDWLPIGVQYIEEEDIYQLRAVCLVKAYGPFESDPAGSVLEIDYIDPQEFNNRIQWGNIGRRLFERALEKKAFLKQNP